MNGSLEVQRGEVIIVANDDTTVLVENISLDLAKGSITLVEKRNHACTIKVLHDERKNSVTVRIDNSFETVEVGHEIILAENSNYLRDRVSSDNIARRRNTVRLPSNMAVGTAEFSFASLLNSSTLAQDVIRGTNHDQKLASRVMRTAACLKIVGEKYGPFTQSRPR
ncbi:MAG: hypothetical protein K2X81_06665 [Candidatus Obscuribacterales bacterium]|nr:hypothetical protein [Candidatus Obscuribacterales bacterium]